MKFLYYLNEAASTTGKKKDLHLKHIEQIAAETGDIEFIKKVFEKVYNYLLGDTTEITVTEKIDGVPILFGKTNKDGFFVALKNKAFDRGKVNTSEMFFKKSDIKNIGDNTGLLQNLWDNLENKVKDNKVYFAELLFSDHSPESSNKPTKNQTKIRKEAEFVLAQPNLLYYKIRGVKDSQKLGLLAIQSGSINDINTLTSETFKDSGFDFDGDSSLFLTDGKLSLKLNEKDPKIKALKKEIDSLKDINLLKDKKFGITEYMKSGNNKELLKISDIKEKFLNIFRTQRNILGLKGIDSDETLDEGLVIKSPDFMVKLVSKDFFLHAQGHYGQKFSGDRGKNISNFTVFFPGKFQPFHNGHLKTFQNLESQFGNGNVIIITSNSNEGLPLNFEDKKKLIMASGIPENAIKDRGSIPMYSFKMAQEFSDPMKSIAVYAIGDKEEDFGRIKENEAIKKVNINVSSSADFDKAKEMVIQSLNAPRENKIHYTFITNPVAIKDGNEDVKAGNIRKKLAAGKDISSLVPYNTKDKEIKNILNKFKEIKNESIKMKWSSSLKNIINESYFGKFISIFEGGNTTFDVGGKTYNVAKIDFVETEKSFSNFKSYLFSFLNRLSTEFGEKYGRTIWPEGELHFSGSSDVVLNKIESYIKDKNKQSLNDEAKLVYRWLKEYKPKAGDIDIQVSEEKVFFENLREFLHSKSISKGQEMAMNEIAFLNKLKKECPNVGDICIIDNKPSIGQIITAAAIRQNKKVTHLNDFLFFQCDWEPVETDKYGTPTEFAKLSRSSSIKDIEAGIKGREHKYLLRTLANVAGEIDTSDLKILSPKTLMPISSKDKGLFSFSVAKGLRKKYWNPNDLQDKKDIISYYKSNTKKPMSEIEIESTLSGKNTRVAIPDNNKIYSTKISDIEEKLELKDIDSFVGLVEYLSKYKKSKAKEIYNLFSDKLIEQLTVAPSTAPGNTLEEKIENAFKEDYDTKLIALNFLVEKLGISSTEDFKMKYKEWKNKQKQVILAKGGKVDSVDFS